jgi:transcriptional regulator with XRE-family HTH domain
VVRGQKRPLHFGFTARLRRAVRASGLTLPALAEAAGLRSRSTAYATERGDNIPRVDTVERLARALNVSPCLLAFGVEDPREPGADSAASDLGERLRSVRLSRGLSMRELGRLSETSVTLVRMSESGATAPTLAKLEALAKALGVAPCWLGFGLGPMEAPTRRRKQATAAADHGAL